ncbi:hypothetical protein ACLOJK_002196 [Asimina triloba]
METPRPLLWPKNASTRNEFSHRKTRNLMQLLIQGSPFPPFASPAAVVLVRLCPRLAAAVPVSTPRRPSASSSSSLPLPCPAAATLSQLPLLPLLSLLGCCSVDLAVAVPASLLLSPLLLNIPRHMLLQTGHLTVLSVLRTDNPTIVNVLVDQVMFSILQNISEIYLHVQTNNEDVINFYKEFGFEITDTIQNYYTNIFPPDCYVLTKFITSAQPKK